MDYEVMVKKKRMAGIAIIVVGLIMGLLAYILDIVTTGKIHSSSTPLYLLLGGLMISVLGAIYIGAGTTEAVRLLNKQVKIMKAELSEKERTIEEQKKGIESLSDARLTGLSQTVDRLEMLDKEEAAKKPEEKPAEVAPPKQAWEKKLDAKRTEKTAELPPPPPKSMVVPAPAKPVAPQALPPPPHGTPKGQALPPPPPKSMQVAPPSKLHEPPAQHAPTMPPKPFVAPTPPVPVQTPKPVAPVIEPKPALTAPVIPPVPPKTEPVPIVVPTPPVKQEEEDEEEDEDEESEEEGEEADSDEEELLPKTTCPRCNNSFTGDWEHCPFCDLNLKAQTAQPPVAEPPETEPAPAASTGIPLLGFTPKKHEPAPAQVVTPPPTPEPAKIPPVPTLDKTPEPPKPVEPKPVTTSIIPPLPDFSKSTTSVPPPPPKSEPPAPVAVTPPAEAAKDKCPSCNKTVKPHWRNCPYCKATLK